MVNLSVAGYNILSVLEMFRKVTDYHNLVTPCYTRARSLIRALVLSACVSTSLCSSLRLVPRSIPRQLNCSTADCTRS